MAKCSREQRDRAVDLYVKYERCAADVIRELGYPSKGALLSWYADRLEEECTGVPSRHGERYRRYSDEQKQAVVDRYLEYGRRLSRTMRMLGYPKSKELLMAWIDELAPRPTQAGARARARGTEAEGGGRGRVRTVEITRGGRRTGRGGVRRRETGNDGCSPDPRRRP